ncbi:MAG TPA: hypothetical protein VLG49_00035 [Rhabdochlamydiaceae bacterium]|nr:hypothetical protein [Rhabdochlamydiaceae bacterium]
METKLSIDPFNPGIVQQLKFYLKVNTSKKNEEDLEIAGGSGKVNMKERLVFIHSPFGKSEKPSDVALGYEKIEKSIQVINGIPILGTITSMLSSIAYLIIRAMTEHEFHKAVSQLFPGDKNKARELFEVGKKHLDEIQCHGNVSDECLKEIAEIILQKKIRNFNSLTRKDFEKISETYLHIPDNRTLNLKEELIQKYAHDFSDVAKQAMLTMWETNMLARSMMGIIPFYKPWTRAVQYSIANRA